MFIYIISAMVFAKLRGYIIKPSLKDLSLYPLAVAELIYIFLQISVFFENYDYIQYASIFKTLYLYTLVVPIIVHKLFKQGFIGSLLVMTGSMLNRFVMSQNGGKMPVYPSLSKYTGYFSEAPLGTVDQIHVLGNEATSYKFLTDYIDIGYSILSIGDIFIHAIIFIVVFSSVRVNSDEKYSKVTRKQDRGVTWKYLK